MDDYLAFASHRDGVMATYPNTPRRSSHLNLVLIFVGDTVGEEKRTPLAGLGLAGGANSRQRASLEQFSGACFAAPCVTSYPSGKKRMQIVCATPHAAAQVLEILLTAHLQIISDFTIEPVFATTPPIVFTLLVIVSAAQVRKIRAVADTTISG